MDQYDIFAEGFLNEDIDESDFIGNKQGSCI